MNLESEIRAIARELSTLGNIPCALMGRNVRETECCSRGLAATAEEFQTCLSCHQGHKLAGLCSWPPRGLLPMVPPPVFAAPASPAHAPQPSPTVGRFLAWRKVQAEPTPERKVQAAKPERKPRSQAAKVKAAPAPKPARQAAPAKPRPQSATRQEPQRWTWKEEPRPRPTVKARPVSTPIAVPPAPPAPVESPKPAPVALPYGLVKLAGVLRQLTEDGRLRITMLDIQRGLRAPTYDAASALVMQAGLRTSRLMGPVETVIVDQAMRELLARAESCEVLQ